MLILIACEESQEICKAFRKLGHEAYSCDLQDCSGGHPEWHIKQSAIPLINGYCKFKTMDGLVHYIDSKWDLLIAHPPCTYLARSGVRYCDVSKYGDYALWRLSRREMAARFFMKFINADCEHIAVENLIGYMDEYYKPPTQYIQSFEHGHRVKKSTGLWLKNLPCIVPTNIVEPEFVNVNGELVDKHHYTTRFIKDNAERSKIRSKTFPGVAKAIATQWSEFLEKECEK